MTGDEGAEAEGEREAGSVHKRPHDCARDSSGKDLRVMWCY